MLFLAVVVVVEGVVAVVAGADAVVDASVATMVSAADAVSLDDDPAAMMPVSTRAASALAAAVICRARRAGWGRRRVAVGVVGVESIPG